MAEKTVAQIDTALNRLARVVSTDWAVPVVDEANGICDRWRQAFVASRVADVLAQLCTDRRLPALSVEDCAWLHGQVEQLVEDALQHFTTVTYTPDMPSFPSRIEQFYREVGEVMERAK